MGSHRPIKPAGNTSPRRLFLLAVVLVFAAGLGQAHPPSPSVEKLFPRDLGSFHVDPLSMRPLVALSRQGILRPDYFGPVADPKSASPFIGGELEYSSADGTRLLVEIVKLQSDSEAFSLLSLAASKMGGDAEMRFRAIGAASIVDSQGVVFYKGPTFARVTDESKTHAAAAADLARQLAETFDKGDDDIPVLVQHLPEWQTPKRRTVYAVSLSVLRDTISNQAILNELNFEGGTEAVVGSYGQAQLAIVEFTTPQFSIDNDQRIVAKIQELKSQNQPAPTAYRRVGNYSVFVFNAWDEKGANQLIDQVKYQQVVQWLGDDPHLFERIQRAYAEMSASVFVAVLKSSGLSLLACIGLGGMLGALMFRRRRSQQYQAALYSDAGGMTRLNIDELTGTTDPRRLLGPGNQPKSDSAGS